MGYKIKLIAAIALILISSGCNEIIPVTTNPEYFEQAAKGLNQAKRISEEAQKRADEANSILDEEPLRQAQGEQALKITYYKVTKVVDGDTIDVNIDGQVERVRMIGVNTPEAVDPRKTVECFGREASDKAHELLDGREIELEADPSQTDRDKYNRLLRYVRTKAGLFYNLEIIKLGYAYEYTYDLPYKYQVEFKAAQKEAKNKKAGLWADGACGTVDL